jgi:hypothetical protein
MPGHASTGTIAFAGMARSYKERDPLQQILAINNRGRSHVHGRDTPEGLP